MMGRFWGAWSRFWFAEGPGLNLGLFRILFAAAAAWDVGSARAVSRFAIEGGFHLPYLGFLPLLSPSTYEAIHTAQYPLLALLGLGLLTRPAAAALLLLQGYVFFADQLNFRNHGYLILLVLVIFAVLPGPNALSVDRALASRLGPAHPREGARGPLTRQRLIQVQITLMYAFAALHKLNGPFLRGEVLSANLTTWLPIAPISSLLSPGALAAYSRWVSDPHALLVPAIASALLELSLPAALWWSRSRPWGIAAGVVFHVTVWLTMNIGSFSAVVLASYLLFIDPDAITRRFRISPAGSAAIGTSG